MTEQELLQAISKMMDEKLEPVHNNIKEIKSDISTIKTNISEMSEEIGEIQSAMNIVIEWIDDAAQDKRLPPFATAK